MSRILKRPMFRKGGEVTEGIVSMAQPRKNYAYGPGPNQMDNDQLARQAERYANIAAKIYGSTAPSVDPAAKALIDFGTKFMAARPVGGGGLKGLLTTAAKPGSEAAQLYFNELSKEDAAKKQLKMFGLQQAFGENIAQIKARREYAKDKLLSDERREIEIQKELSKLYGPQMKDGIEIRTEVIDRAGIAKIARTLNEVSKGRVKLSEKETLSGANVSRAPIVDGSITNPNYLDKKTKEPDPTLYKPGQFYVNHDGDIYFYQGKNKFKKVFDFRSK